MTKWNEYQRHRVADLVKHRRENELGISQKEAVERAGGGVSEPVWSIIENARQDSYKPRTLKAVCRALGWTPNSIDDIVTGKAPTLANPTTSEPLVEPAHVDHLRRAVKRERLSRGWSYEDTRIGGFSAAFWQAFEEGGPFSVDMQYGVCIAFNWPHDWMSYILAGRDPNVPTYHEFESTVNELQSDVSSLRGEVERLAQAVKLLLERAGAQLDDEMQNDATPDDPSADEAGPPAP